jgi:uncharacterized protein (UPF0333 family)
MLPHSRSRRESGQGAVEFLIALPVLLLLLGGAIQYGLVFTAKNTIDYAAFQATRAATLDHGSIRAFKTAFAAGLAPLFPSGKGITGYDTAIGKALLRVNNPAKLHIQVLNPTSTVLQSVQDGGWVEKVVRENGQTEREIPNSRLIFATDGQTHGGESLQAANLLKIRVTYCYPLWVPYVSEVIGKLMANTQGSKWEHGCYAAGGIPIAAVSTQLMQSSLYPQKVTDLTAPGQAPTTAPKNTPPPTPPGMAGGGGCSVPVNPTL